jgi:outer membrane protein TolC
MLKQMELELQAAELQTRAAVDQLRPDLSLSLGLTTNGSVLNASDDFNTRWGNTLSAKFPAYSVGLLFRIPLDGSAEKSQALQAASGRFQLESKYSEWKDQLISNFETSCVELKMLGQHDRLYRKIETDMKRRISMEETRYRQARVSPFTVLQAGDELYGATISVSSNLAHWWEKRWELDKTKGTLFGKLDQWVKEKSGKTIFEKTEEEMNP